MGPPLPSPTDLPTARCAAGRRAVADRCPRRPRPSPRAGARPGEGSFYLANMFVLWMIQQQKEINALIDRLKRDNLYIYIYSIYITNTVNICYVAHGHPSDNGNPNILDIKMCSDDHPLWTIYPIGTSKIWRNYPTNTLPF